MLLKQIEICENDQTKVELQCKLLEEHSELMTKKDEEQILDNISKFDFKISFLTILKVEVLTNFVVDPKDINLQMDIDCRVNELTISSVYLKGFICNVKNLQEYLDDVVTPSQNLGEFTWKIGQNFELVKGLNLIYPLQTDNQKE
jgi:hypothetical protein